MEIDIYVLMEETDFKRIITIKKLHELTGKDLKECTTIVTAFMKQQLEFKNN